MAPPSRAARARAAVPHGVGIGVQIAVAASHRIVPAVPAPLPRLGNGSAAAREQVLHPRPLPERRSMQLPATALARWKLGRRADATSRRSARARTRRAGTAPRRVERGRVAGVELNGPGLRLGPASAARIRRPAPSDGRLPALYWRARRLVELRLGARALAGTGTSRLCIASASGAPAAARGSSASVLPSVAAAEDQPAGCARVGLGQR